MKFGEEMPRRSDKYLDKVKWTDELRSAFVGAPTLLVTDENEIGSYVISYAQASPPRQAAPGVELLRTSCLGLRTLDQILK